MLGSRLESIRLFNYPKELFKEYMHLVKVPLQSRLLLHVQIFYVDIQGARCMEVKFYRLWLKGPVKLPS